MRYAVIGLTLLLTGCGSQAQSPDEPKRLTVADTYTHSATGFKFPRSVGKFKRSAITEYNQEKTDVGVGYDNVAAHMAVTVYVYPAPPLTSIGSPQAVIDDARNHLCTQAWEGIKAEIVQAHPDAELIALENIGSPSPVYNKVGRKAVFRFSGNLGGQTQPVHSEADLFCYAGGRWLVSYRTTTPEAFDYRSDLDTLMHSLQWPSGLTG